MSFAFYNPDATPIPIAEFHDRVMALYEPPLRAPNTRLAMRHALKQLLKLDGIATTFDLTPATIARFITARPFSESPNTTRAILARIRAACSVAVGEGVLKSNPFAFRRNWVRAVSTKVPAIHSRAEIAKIFDLARRDVMAKRGWAKWRAHRLYALVAVLAYTGIRRNEALYLRREDIDFAAGMILIRARVGGMPKTDASAQPVPIPEALAPILARWLIRLDKTPPRIDLSQLQMPEGHKPLPPWLTRQPAGRPDTQWVFPNTHRTNPWTGGPSCCRALGKIKKLGARAGVRGVTFQSFRHSWATHAEYWGLSDAVIQRVLRHTNTRTQWKYRHAETANLREVMGGIGFAAVAEDGASAGDPSAAIAAGLAEIAENLGDRADDPLREIAGHIRRIVARVAEARKEAAL